MSDTCACGVDQLIELPRWRRTKFSRVPLGIERLALRQVEIDRQSIILIVDIRINHDGSAVFGENEVDVGQFPAQRLNLSINDVAGFAKRLKLNVASIWRTPDLIASVHADEVPGLSRVTSALQ